MNGTIRERKIKRIKDEPVKSKRTRKSKDINEEEKKEPVVYDVYYRYTDAATGKSKQTSKKGFHYLDEAKMFLQKINSDMLVNDFIQLQKITVREYLNTWVSNYVDTNLRDTTRAGYKLNIEKHIIPHLGNIKLQSLSANHLDNFYALKLKHGRLDGKGGLSATSVLYIHRVLNEALKHAEKKRLVSRNVAGDVTILPRKKKYRPELYKASEMQELLKIVRGSELEIPVLLAGLCGMRRGEVLGLMWKDIDYDESSIRIERQLIPTKDGLKFEDPKSEESNRVIVVPTEVIKSLKDHKKRQAKLKILLGESYIDLGLVNCRPDGKPYDPRNFSNLFANTLAKNKLKHIRFHDLRHSYATLMLALGVQMKTTSELLGHSTIGITADLYTHVLTDVKKDAAEKIGNLIFKKAD